MSLSQLQETLEWLEEHENAIKYPSSQKRGYEELYSKLKEVQSDIRNIKEKIKIKKEEMYSVWKNQETQSPKKKKRRKNNFNRKIGRSFYNTKSKKKITQERKIIQQYIKIDF